MLCFVSAVWALYLYFQQAYPIQARANARTLCPHQSILYAPMHVHVAHTLCYPTNTILCALSPCIEQPVARHTHAHLNWDDPYRRFFWVLAMYCWTRAAILSVGKPPRPSPRLQCRHHHTSVTSAASAAFAPALTATCATQYRSSNPSTS